MGSDPLPEHFDADAEARLADNDCDLLAGSFDTSYQVLQIGRGRAVLIAAARYRLNAADPVNDKIFDCLGNARVSAQSSIDFVQNEIAL